MQYIKYLFLTAFVVALAGAYSYYSNQYTSHPIGYADNPDEVHVHSDFVVFIDGQEIDLTDDRYQSKTEQILHAHIHLHDNNDEVIHRHDHGITLEDFFNSLGFTLTEDCITTDEGAQFCSNDEKQLLLYVNKEPVTPISSYINQEEDQILLYYGKPEDTIVADLLENITDTACIYSGTCPERGTAPPESCGLTCEL